MHRSVDSLSALGVGGRCSWQRPCTLRSYFHSQSTKCYLLTLPSPLFYSPVGVHGPNKLQLLQVCHFLISFGAYFTRIKGALVSFPICCRIKWSKLSNPGYSPAYTIYTYNLPLTTRLLEFITQKG